MTRLDQIVIYAMLLGQFTSANAAFASTVPMTLKKLITVDVREMERMVDRTVNMREKNDEVYFDQVAEALAFRVLPHPSFNVRSAGISRLAMKLSENSEWQDIYERAAQKLMDVYHDSNDAADRATVIAGLTNLVTEIRSKGKNFKPLIEKIKDANVTVTKDAADYARDPLRHLVSPSREASLSL